MSGRIQRVRRDQSPQTRNPMQNAGRTLPDPAHPADRGGRARRYRQCPGGWLKEHDRSPSWAIANGTRDTERLSRSRQRWRRPSAARWCDPEHPDIPPTCFIEIAEDNGLIIDIGSWVVRAACRYLRKWTDTGYVIPIAINISAKELVHDDPAKWVEAEAAGEGVHASRDSPRIESRSTRHSCVTWISHQATRQSPMRSPTRRSNGGRAQRI